MTYHCLCLGDRRGEFGSSYRCSSFGGRCTYIHHLFQRMLWTCGVWSAYGSLTAVLVWEARLSSLRTVFRFLCLSGILGMVARLSGWQQVRAALYAYIHRGPSGRCLVGMHRIHGFLARPVLSAHCTAPYATLPYPTLPGPTCLPLYHAHPPLCVLNLTSLRHFRVAILHYTVQLVMAMTTSAPCSWRRGLTSQLQTR